MELDDITNKQVLRIKRKSMKKSKWKTIVLVEINSIDKIEYISKFRKVLNGVALIREMLLNTESVDLYLMLFVNNIIGINERLRIEATEQICRKYVQLPEEKIQEFISRTFFQKFGEKESKVEGQDPVDKAFVNTGEEYAWFSRNIQNQWRKYFTKYSGSDLAEKLIFGEDIINAD